MKNVLAFLTVLKSRDGYLQNLIKAITEKKCVRRNAANLEFFSKTVAGTLPNEERFGDFDCFEVSRWLFRKLDKNNYGKKCVRRNAVNLEFFSKIAAGTFPNEEAFGVFDCFEVSR